MTNVLIVDEVNMLPADLLSVVLVLFHLEDVLDEKLLEVLVGVVDAELLEAVVLEVLKAENVQYANRQTAVAHIFWTSENISLTVCLCQGIQQF